ncbi:exocyst complex component EXO70E2-like [Rutidosis leptorrhynchoides]|uniref:exocyst complex component EXO70E2-like n=1 Tax=Rutidosis leptorrhynchoides TaxID=125765 RepID=UPI003A992658
MESCEPTNLESLEDESLITAAEKIVKALGSGKHLTDGVRKALVDLGSQLSNSNINVSTLNDEVTTLNDEVGDDISEIAERLNVIQDKIMSWEVDQSTIWNSGQDEAFEYLNATNEARKLTERLENICLDKDKELLQKARDILQTALSRLEEEFRQVLVQNKQPFEPEHMSFRSVDEDCLDMGSTASFEEESTEDSLQRDSISRASAESMIDLIHTDVIPYLRFISQVMFNSNRENECTEGYISVRKESLGESLSTLEMEKMSEMGPLLKMEWGTLDSKIRRWVRVTKHFVRICLPSEKWLSDRIFEETGSSASLLCFIEISKAFMLRLLNFGEAISIGPHRPEKLIRILDMYEMLSELLPDVDALYSDEAGSSVRNGFHGVLQRLGDCVRLTFIEFENAVAENTSVNPFAGGGIHHLTGYVMNYLKILTDYSKTLDLLLLDETGGGLPCKYSPMAHHFQSVVLILESNLYDKSKLYKDVALQHFFLMNNVHYLTQKVKNSELRDIFGDDWIRKHNRKFQQHAMDYERATWSSILGLLREDGSKTVVKEKFRSFYVSFEEVYKTQTAWVVRDVELREDLRISTSLKVIQAYRTFCGRHNNNISDKHIKYSADDLENYLMDLFNGSPKSLHCPRKLP